MKKLGRITTIESYKVLIVDDEPNMLHMLSAVLKEDGFECETANNAQEALEHVKNKQFDFILSDVRMPGIDGLKLLELLKERGVTSMVILMSAYGAVDLALTAMRKGAYDYISKPFKTDEVVLTFRKAAERERLRREVVKLRRKLKHYEGHTKIVAESQAMRDLLHEIRLAAPFDSSVLITGESGTGKEVLARELHSISPRAEGDFIAINCGAIPGSLLEAELFGYARGAFTGASVEKPGLFEEADHGVLFLDEIANLELGLQSKLLRMLDSGEVRRIGENSFRKISARIIAATNDDLSSAIESGRFRQDLYYRLNVMRFHIPPLRDRKEDIGPLIEHFVQAFNEKLGSKITGISKPARDALVHGNWKGNVRELQNVVERAMILTSGQVIELESLPGDIAPPAFTKAQQLIDTDNLSLKKAYKELEKTMISRALNKTAGNRSQAAMLLEISYPSILQKIKEFGIT